MASRVVGTRRSTMNRRRRGPLSVIMPWIRRFGFFMLILVVGAWIGVWMLISGGFQKTSDYVDQKLVNITAAMGFTIENVLIEGRVYTDPENLKNMIGVEKGTPLFALKPAQVKTNVEGLDWVRSVTVQRRLPGTVFVKIEEHQPLTLWQTAGTLKLLDEAGQVINTPYVAQFKSLMIVMGDEAPAHAADLISNLQAEPDLQPLITSAKWIDGRRWDLQTKQNIEIKLPEGEIGLALRRLADAQAQEKILEKDITEIDLREPERLIVRTRPGATEEFRAGQAKAGDNI